jgi:hypothetical protein
LRWAAAVVEAAATFAHKTTQLRFKHWEEMAVQLARG